MTIIYVHHYYNIQFFQKLFHNVQRKNSDINDFEFNSVKEIEFIYRGENFNAIFNPEINDNPGIHILDYYGGIRQRGQNDVLNIPMNGGSEAVLMIKKFADLIEDKKDWIVSIYRTEKLFIKNENFRIKSGGTEQISEAEEQILRLKNHHILSDNVFLNDSVKNKYPNVHHPFTNILFQWNELVGIRWFHDYRFVFENINPKYKIGFAIRAHKPNRLEIGEGLVNVDGVFVSQTNVITDKSAQPMYKKIENAHLNDYDSTIDFENLRILNNITIGLDYFLKILPMAKMQICDESWSSNVSDYTSQYLSEKTIGLILAKIPFISTHSYAYECLSKLIGIRPHPFFDESKQYQGKPDLFVDFVKKFLENFDENYEKCKVWNEECYNIFINKLYNENSMLDMILDNNMVSREVKELPLL